MEHTKEKWEIGKGGIGNIVIIGGINRDYICKIQLNQIGGGEISETMINTRKANARRICTAVNSHDALLDSLKELTDIVDEILESGLTNQLDTFTLQPAKAAIASVEAN